MYNATTKPQILMKMFCPIALLCFVASLATSCSNDNRGLEAREMLNRARMASENGKFETAQLLIDSIDMLYPEATDVRREGITLMATVREGLINTRIALTDSLLAVAQLRGDSLQRLLRKIDNPIEPYFVVGGLGTVNNGLDPRLMPDGSFYILSRLSSPKIRHTSISVCAPDGTSASTTSVNRDGEQNDDTGGVETITFVGSDADTIGRFVTSHRNEPLELRFISANSRSTAITLSPKQIEAIKVAYGYADNIRERKILNIRRHALEEQLGLNRSQSATLH